MSNLIISKIREMKPLIHHITNYVTVYDCAQITLSCGALPVMADAEEEAAEMASYADALVINIGTLNAKQVASMIKAGKSANIKNIPVILDPVGAGATEFRKQTAEKILSEIHISVIKGNPAEITAIAGAFAQMKGVESIGSYDKIEETAFKTAKSFQSTVVVTGKTDIVTNGSDLYTISNGHPLMGRIVGTGCMSASVIASHCAVDSNYAKASAQALAVYGLAGEKAAVSASTPLLFKQFFMDNLSTISDGDLDNLKIS